MKNGFGWRLLFLAILAIAVTGLERLQGRHAGDQAPESGPEVVILNELEDRFEPVPFDHFGHAKMAEMWQGCETCHHHSPQHVDGATSETLQLQGPVLLPHSQDEAATIPACKSCHPVSGVEVEIHMPNLKGAYHRQCLNCHKDWMHENACAICHEPRQLGPHPTSDVLEDPTPDDIIGRMHPPIPEPADVFYRTRFTPADGPNVLFRHRGHTVDFGIRCVQCHIEDNCSHCHDGSSEDTTEQKPVHPGMRWEDSHEPCMRCHQQSHCDHCHYKDGDTPPPPFDHRNTGQELDEDHRPLACALCHEDLDVALSPTCGSTECHPNAATMPYPEKLPGALLTPTSEPVQEAVP